MKKISYLSVCAAALLFAACSGNSATKETQNQAIESHEGHNHEGEDGHDHAAEAADPHAGHNHAPAPSSAAPAHEHENLISLTPQKAKEAGITTAKVEKQKFSEVIPATGKILAMQGDVVAITAKTDGFVMFGNKKVLSGTSVSQGEKLMVVTTAGITQENYSEQVAQAEIDYNKTKDLYERNQKLYADNLVTASQLQESKAAYELAALRLSNLRKGFEKDGLAVTAAISGYITDIYVGEGDYVQRGQTLFTVSKNRNVTLAAEVSPQFLEKLSRVTSANFRTSADGEYFSVAELGGRVASVGRSVNSATLLVPINFTVPYNGRFATGAFAEVKLLASTGDESIVVPQSALVEDFGIFFVYTSDAHGYERRDVKIGGRDGKNVQITSGLTEGETVVVTGAARLKLIERLSSGSGEAAAHAGHSH